MTDIELPEGVSDPPKNHVEELSLAARNHGMPLEAPRYDITPAGHALPPDPLRHPRARRAAWRLAVDGLVRTPLAPRLADLRARPAVTPPVTLECAGNGRARLNPRPMSQPWLDEAVGTAEWTGTPLRAVLGRPAPHRRRWSWCSPAPTAACRRRRARLRAEPPDRRRPARRRPPRVRDERRPAAAPARLPAPAGRPGLVRHDQREVADRITAVTEPFEGFQQGVPVPQSPRTTGHRSPGSSPGR